MCGEEFWAYNCSCRFPKESYSVKGKTMGANRQLVTGFQAPKHSTPQMQFKSLNYLTTQFQIEGGGLVQGVTKLITILLTFVT